MPVINRKCNYCGNEYYICRSCIKAGNAWKNVCCSRECFMALMEEKGIAQPIKIEIKEKDMKKTLLRGVLKSGLSVDVTGYDLDLGRFDCTDGKTYTYNDMKIFYIPSDELKDMIGKLKVDTEAKTKALNKKNDVKKVEVKAFEAENKTENEVKNNDNTK